MPKVALLAKLTAQPGRRDDLVAAMKPMIDAVAGEPGTEVYVMHTADDEPDVVWFYEVYADEDAFKAHGSSVAMKEAGGRLAGLLGGRPDLIRLTPVGAKGVAAG